MLYRELCKCHTEKVIQTGFLLLEIIEISQKCHKLQAISIKPKMPS